MIYPDVLGGLDGNCIAIFCQNALADDIANNDVRRLLDVKTNSNETCLTSVNIFSRTTYTATYEHLSNQ